MPVYSVTLTAEVCTVVEAKDEEAAKKKAKKLDAGLYDILRVGDAVSVYDTGWDEVPAL